MFNVSGTELLFLLVVGLVVLGPEKLPGVIRRVGQVYREIKSISDGFRQAVSDVVDEPMRELRGTTDSIKEAISRIPEPDELKRDDPDSESPS